MTWKGIHRVSYEEMLHSDLYGRLAVALREQGIPLSPFSFASLKLKEAREFIERKKILTKRQVAELSGAYQRKASQIAGDLVDYVKTGVSDWATKLPSVDDVLVGLGEKLGSLGVTAQKPHHFQAVFETICAASEQHGRYRQQVGQVIERPYWQYQTAGDDRVRPSHAEMDGAIYPAEHPVWDVWYPPNGFRCRCTVISMTRSEVKERTVREDYPSGLPDRGFDATPEQWLDTRI